MNDIFVFIV